MNPPEEHPRLKAGRGRPDRSAGPLAKLLAGLLVLFLLAFLVVPVLLTIGAGFFHRGSLSTYWIGRVLGNEMLLRQLVNGLTVAAVTTLICLAVGIPLAVVRTKYRFLGSGVLGALLLVPLILPPFVGALSMRRLLGQYGVINLVLERVGLLDPAATPPDWLGTGFAGVVVLQVLHLFPILYLNASAALANVDPAAAQAARNLGAGPIRTFFRITLPMIRPGLFAGGTIVFIWSFTDIGTPLIVGYEELIPVTVFQRLSEAEVSPQTFSLVFIMLLTAVSLYVLGKFVFGRSAAAEAVKGGVASEERRLGLLGTLGAWVLFGSVIFLALLPHVGVVLTAISTRWINTILPSGYTLAHLRFVVTKPSTYNSILNSLTYAGTSTTVDIVLGCIAAWLLVRTRFRGRTTLDGLTMLPLAVPGLILAAGYVAMTVKGSPLAAIGPGRNPFTILVIAYAVRRLPFVVRGVSAGLQQVPVAMEEAGRNLGASRARTALRITLPLVAANIIAAGVLTFAFAMLEVSDSLILAQEQVHYPITKEIYKQASSGNVDAANIAAAIGVYGMGLLAGTFAVAGALMGKRLGAIFRA
ncbi:MAG TPA: iron ABC transporter permease [Phycisphaerae bacterium]|nr:iron ABC transporter permease [Phycisphaerae bacterium]